MIRRPPSSPLFPSTPLFRSLRAREPPVREPGRAAFAGDEGVLLEVAADAVVEHVEGERVAVARGDMEVRRLADRRGRSEEHTSELQSRQYIVCRLLLEKKKK